MADVHLVDQDQALTVWGWLQGRGGILIWDNILIGDSGGGWTTPALDENGEPYGRPTWKAAEKPSRHITDPAEVAVYKSKEVKRFHVAVRMGSQGLSQKVTSGGSNRIRAEVEKAQQKYKTSAWYGFDYGDYRNAVIYVSDGQIPISEFVQGLQGVPT